MELGTVAEFLRDKCFGSGSDPAGLGAKAAGARRAVFVGCGDSYSAAGAMLPGFRKLSGLKRCFSPDVMDFLGDPAPYGTDRPEDAITVGVSFSGSSEKVADALKKASSLGSGTFLITGNAESRCAEEASEVIDVSIPEGLNTPGVRSYFASMFGIVYLGAAIGLDRGLLNREEFSSAGASAAEYMDRFMAGIDGVDSLMFEQAEKLRGYTKFEIIGDWNEGYSAQFIEQKLIECSGVYCDHTTSEEFAHISLMFRMPEETATMVLVNSADTSLGRMKDTINGCLAQHRPVIIVTDADPKVFSEHRGIDPSTIHSAYKPDVKGGGEMSTAVTDKPCVCRIPTPPEQWMSPLADFIPGTLLAGYHAAINGRNFFSGRYDWRNDSWIGR
jgi:glucosamine--fructose-6-phosphate aminotransferase (isomerizing)